MSGNDHDLTPRAMVRLSANMQRRTQQHMANTMMAHHHASVQTSNNMRAAAEASQQSAAATQQAMLEIARSVMCNPPQQMLADLGSDDYDDTHDDTKQKHPGATSKAASPAWNQ